VKISREARYCIPSWREKTAGKKMKMRNCRKKEQAILMSINPKESNLIQY
jgi:hypothetical protein